MDLTLKSNLKTGRGLANAPLSYLYCFMSAVVGLRLQFPHTIQKAGSQHLHYISEGWGPGTVGRAPACTHEAMGSLYNFA